MGHSNQVSTAMNNMLQALVSLAFLATAITGATAAEASEACPNCTLAIHGHCVNKPELTCVRSQCSWQISYSYWTFNCISSQFPRQCIGQRVGAQCATCICTMLGILGKTTNECAGPTLSKPVLTKPSPLPPIPPCPGTEKCRNAVNLAQIECRNQPTYRKLWCEVYYLCVTKNIECVSCLVEESRKRGKRDATEDNSMYGIDESFFNLVNMINKTVTDGVVAGEETAADNDGIPLY